MVDDIVMESPENINKIEEDHGLDKEVVTKKSIRDTLYGKINVSVKTMDIVITILMVALFASIILGMQI